jgi:hypothetical protein
MYLLSMNRLEIEMRLVRSRRRLTPRQHPFQARHTSPDFVAVTFLQLRAEHSDRHIAHHSQQQVQAADQKETGRGKPRMVLPPVLQIRAMTFDVELDWRV